MATNEELVQKAVITTDALAAAGKLPPMMANKFVDYVIEETALARVARTVRIAAGESWEIDKMGVGRRVAVPSNEAQDPGVRRGVTTSKVTLTPREIVVPFEIGDRFKQINIQGADVEDAIVRMMARAFANDAEELQILGDVLGPACLESDYIEGGASDKYRKDSYLALFDGVLKSSNAANVVDAGGASIGASLFSRAVRSMPTKFRRNRAALRWLWSPDMGELWRERVSGRATGAGDAALGGADTPRPLGITPVDVPLMPFEPRIVKHVVLNGTTPASLGFAPVTDVVVTRANLGTTPQAAYIETTDYVVDAAAGTVARNGGGAIGDGDTVKVTFSANPQIILCDPANIIVGISLDVSIERARDIFRKVNQYVITTQIGLAIEEPTAMVKIVNVGKTI